MRFALALGAFPPLLTACGERGGTADLVPFDELVTAPRQIALEENDDVINVTPVVTLDPAGGFLVADDREGQVRSYSADGRLNWHAGRKGNGPGEFRGLSRAIRLPDGRVLATEWQRGMTLYDSSGTFLRTLRTPFRQVEDLAIIQDSLLLVTALREDAGLMGPRLHLWDPSRNRVIRSFFRPFQTQKNAVAATIANWAKVAVRGDTVAAITALADTVYLFSVATGASLGDIPLRIHNFRHVGDVAPEGGSDPVRRAKWLGTFDVVQNVHWLPDGRLLVVYQNLRPDQALTRAWNLFGTDRTGTPLFEARDVPPLLAVDEHDGRLIFRTPGNDEPNRWSIARLR